MNWLDVFLWASAIGLWVWVVVEITSSVLKFKDTLRETKNKVFWTRDILDSHKNTSDTRHLEIIGRIEKLEKRCK